MSTDTEAPALTWTYMRDAEPPAPGRYIVAEIDYRTGKPITGIAHWEVAEFATPVGPVKRGSWYTILRAPYAWTPLPEPPPLPE